MLFHTSGRKNFSLIEWPASEGPYPISRDGMKDLLLRERELRLSSECQNCLDEAFDAHDFETFVGVSEKESAIPGTRGVRL